MGEIRNKREQEARGSKGKRETWDKGQTWDKKEIMKHKDLRWGGNRQ